MTFNMGELREQPIRQALRSILDYKDPEQAIDEVTKYVQRIALEARIDELKSVNGWALGSHLNTASLHKWYGHYDNRSTKLKSQLQQLETRKEGSDE